MPYCPKCRYEYEEQIKICPDCGSELVASLPDKESGESAGAGKTYDEWIKIARLTSRDYSEMLLEGLRSKDIPVVILSSTGHFGEIGTMGTFTFPPIGGGYAVLVPEEFVADADREAESILGDVWKAAKLVDIEE